MSEIALLSGYHTGIDLDTIIHEDGFFYLDVWGSRMERIGFAVTRDDLVALNNSLTKFLEEK